MRLKRVGARWRIGLLVLSAACASPALADQAVSQCAVPAPFVAINAPLEGIKAALPASVFVAVNNTPVTLVNYWAIWCPPCRKELPMLASLKQALVSTQSVVSMTAIAMPIVAIETVHVGDNMPAITATFEKLDVAVLGTAFIDDFNAVRQLGFKGLPATAVTVNGTARYRADGYLHTDPQVLTDWLVCLSTATQQVRE
ncbi:TlpA family protein disulfide reductase [Photobacterium japonica]|uniref:thioredoxin domain-containing protein n=1 Tax=Photobacterium japonica TaxID=2910235 RepID=UPI003D0FE78F